MFVLNRIYGYLPQPGQCAVFADRLYPRGIRKEIMQQLVWLKAVTPSAELRRWYHQAPEQRFDGFAARYLEELQDPDHQAAVAELCRLEAEHGTVWLLSAVRNPEHSHLSVLKGYLIS